MRKLLLLLFIVGFSAQVSHAQHSVARQWNEVLLQSIREDYARPTVHARNLFHSSVAMWDAWAAYDAQAEPFLLGNAVQGFECAFDGIPAPASTVSARNMAISYASYRLLKHRFTFSPGAASAMNRYQEMMNRLGYDTAVTSTNYQSGDPASLGNYIASCIIEFGMQDGANEDILYLNRFYQSVNPPMAPPLPGNPNIQDMNRWQPLSFDVFVDQSGNEIPLGTPDFLGPEWGSVVPFSLSTNDLKIFERDGDEYWVYHDPGAPPYLDVQNGGGLSDEYKWNFALVAVWSAHLDPTDGVLWDVSPARIGNIDINTFPRDIESLRDFYDLIEGGDPGLGHRINPATNAPYWAQMVPRGDYARVLAEFWADGPDSETPPGHWYTILNHVNDDPLLEKRFKGAGPILDDLEWDVKAYLALGGTMHDAAITAWGIKGWYDYIRPISALRGMAEFGQSSDSALSRFHPAGIPLIPGYIEMVLPGDPLIGALGEELHKIKILGWRGPEFVFNPEEDEGGVGWVLADNWWPYQRPSFVTPPFAGYVSGHSTFSRAAAEMMTLFTGDEFFPGGMGQFVAPKNEFLVFEDGPSEDVILQWATYRDASDQCSLSRIWGGIHPPADDIPGRLMGEKIGIEAFAFAERFFSGQATDIDEAEVPVNLELFTSFPNPIRSGQHFRVDTPEQGTLTIVDLQGRVVKSTDLRAGTNMITSQELSSGVYMMRLATRTTQSHRSLIVLN